ncbi:hypothetical protein F5Y15DRAFT_381725 [Xylariaceae sp. FL0016]|nr:hypothetical protein F5Y15DRAFT_381725 [Xylariaceae sp. FL0016]
MSDASDRDDLSASEHDEADEVGASSSDVSVSGDDGRENFLDIEAVESDDQSDESSPSEADSRGLNSDDTDSDGGRSLLDIEASETNNPSEGQFYENEIFYFPQFTLLPPELRALIWSFFDRDLTSDGRVFEFRSVALSYCIELWENASLEQQTAPSKAMLATCCESRTLALKHYPDIFEYRGGKSVVRFNRSQDIIAIEEARSPLEVHDILLATREQVNFLALPITALKIIEYHFTGIKMTIETLPEGIYFYYNAEEIPSRDLQWISDDKSKSFLVQTFEEEPGLGEDLEYMYCWADIRERHKWTEHQRTLNKAFFQNSYGNKVAGMVRFNFEPGVARYDKIRAAAIVEGNWDDKYSSSSSEAEDLDSNLDSEPDEYENDGFIVDTESEEGAESSTEGDDQDEGDDVVSSGLLNDDASAFNGLSPLQDAGPEDEDVNEQPAPGFSSLEPESPSEGETHQPAHVVAVSRSKRLKRRIVSSDEEESDSEGKNLREVKQHSRPAKRARVLLSDSEEEEEEEEDNEGVARGSEVEEDNSRTESSSEDDDESEEEPRKKPLSLLQRLAQFKSDNPVATSGSSESRASSDDEASEAEEWNRDEDDDDEYPDGEDALVADMAEDGEEGGDDDEDGW